MSIFDTPRDIRKRQEPRLSVIETVLHEADIRNIIDKEEKRLKQEAFQKALSDYKSARLELERAKRRYGTQVDAIRMSIGLPKFLDSL